jgi:hypothetical protein
MLARLPLLAEILLANNHKSICPMQRASSRALWAEAGCLYSQTLAAFGAACIDNCAPTACLHANQKTVSTGAANFGGLVSAFHINLNQITQTQAGQPSIIANFVNQSNSLGTSPCLLSQLRNNRLKMWIRL